MKNLSIFLILALGFASTAYGENIDYSHITITDSSPGFNADFDVSNIVTNNGNLPDTNGLSYASQGAAADTFVDFMFDGNYSFDSVTYVDRLHSGATADTIGGTADFVTEYSLIFSANSDFGDADDTVVSVGPLTTPVSPSGADDFTTETAIGGVTGQYVRFDVVATNGGNPGAHTFFFDGALVPEPMSNVMLLMGFASLMGIIRRRR